MESEGYEKKIERCQNFFTDDLINTLPEDLVVCVQLRNLCTILRVEASCTNICTLVEQNPRPGLLRTTYMFVSGW